MSKIEKSKNILESGWDTVKRWGLEIGLIGFGAWAVGQAGIGFKALGVASFVVGAERIANKPSNS